MTHPDLLWLYALSLFGLVAVPAALGRAVWAFPAAFAALNAFLLFSPASLHPYANPWICLLLSQAPWVLFALDLIARGRLSVLADRISLRSLLGWSLLHFLGIRYVFAAFSGDLPPAFAVGSAFGETVIALGALLLWALYRPRRLWFRALLIFWNTYALMTSLSLGFRILRAHPALPRFAEPAPDVHRYFMAWPNAWEPFFWIPLCVAIEAAVFFKLYRGAGSEAPQALPEVSP